MAKTNWLVYGGLLAVLVAGYFFRCKIPFLNKYLCPGGEGGSGEPPMAPPMDQPMPLPMPMPAPGPAPFPGVGGAGIAAPAAGMPEQLTPVASFAKVHGVRRR